MSLLNIYLLVLTILLGLAVGSFLNVVIYRLPRNMSLASPPSHCTSCNYQLRWFDNIPLFSYIFLRGRCRKCGEKISIRYPLIELANMILWFACLTIFTDTIIKSNTNDYIMFGVSCIACSILTCVFFCDYDNMEIPDEFQVLLLILGLISMFSNYVTVYERVIGFFVGGGFFALIYYIFLWIRKKEGLGWGDTKLMAVTGLILGFKSTIFAIIIASVFGSIILLILSLIKKEGANKEYPFAVFLVPACITALFFGEVIVKWYMSLFGI